MEQLAIAAFLSLVANKLIDGLIKPIWVKYELPSDLIFYLSWVMGALLVYISGVNLFVDYIPSHQIGQVLTAVTAGGGASFLHDLFDKR